MLSKKIEHTIREQLKSSERHSDSYQMHDSLKVAEILELEAFAAATVARVVECVEAKKQFWQSASNGFASLIEYRDVASKLIVKVESLLLDFDR